MPLADRLIVTHVEDTPLEADAFFPPIDPTVWREVSRDSHSTDEKHHFPYSFVDYERI
jgi:dihydrofolate reductase